MEGFQVEVLRPGVVVIRHVLTVQEQLRVIRPLNIFLLSIINQMKCVFHNDNDVNILLPQQHDYSKSFATRDRHEVIFRQIHTSLIKTGAIQENIIDSGAWIGDNTIPWALNLPNSVIYAIDPSDKNCQFINTVATLNGITNVRTIVSALGTNDMKELKTDDDLYHCSFMKNTPGKKNKFLESGKISVPCVSLDELFHTKVIEKVGCIHLDVEGMEDHVIVGARELIEVCKPIISFEQHINSDDYQMTSGRLIKLDYDVFMIQEILPGCRKDCRNFICFPKSRKIDLPGRLNSYLKRVDV